MKFYITGIKRGLGKYLHDRLNVVDNFEECDVFINCKHEGFDQVDLLYEAYDWGVSRVINISSNSGDGIKKWNHQYAIEKAALDKANEQLFYLGMNTTSLRLGYMDTERVAEVTENKMSLKSVLDTIEWILLHPHRIKEITITPDEDSAPENMRISDKLYEATDMYATQHKQLPNTYNLEKIREEIEDLPETKDGQLMLQSIDGKDFYTGLLQLDKMPKDKVEEDFNILNVPEDSEIARFINDNGLTRTRLMIMPPKGCYTFHFDPTPRIHLVVKTNEWVFMTDSQWRLFHVPDDGHPWYFDTTKPHTAINSSLEERIHIVGVAPLK
jgi:hypothetical protein